MSCHFSLSFLSCFDVHNSSDLKIDISDYHMRRILNFGRCMSNKTKSILSWAI
uniref:Uncharacterized protein n=1 Tax=Arundo donax TaxID=35708 RepID=A0A0A8ZAG7_ARUDO